MKLRAAYFALLMLGLVVGSWAQRPAARKKATVKKPAAGHASAAGIAPARAGQIQQALVAAGYLDRASGHWDVATAAAMKKFQDDHGWQTRFVPDARALIALGLDAAHPAAASDAPGGG